MSSYNKPAAVHKVEVPFLWLKVFSAGLAAVIVGGVVLGLCLRWYIRSSVQEAWDKTKERREQLDERMNSIGTTLHNIRKDADDLDKSMDKAGKGFDKIMKKATEDALKSKK